MKSAATDCESIRLVERDHGAAVLASGRMAWAPGATGAASVFVDAIALRPR